MYVYSRYETTVISKVKISDESVPMKINVKSGNCPTYVVSSQGPAAKYQGKCLGQYYLWDETGKHSVYKQSNTEHIKNPKYLCYDDGVGAKGWQIGTSKICLDDTLLYNTRASKLIEEKGWVCDNPDTHDPMCDETLTVVKGVFKVGDKITITGVIAEKCSKFTGDFRPTSRMFNGKPMFINDHGKLLYSCHNHKEHISRWVIGDEIGCGIGIRSTGPPTVLQTQLIGCSTTRSHSGSQSMQK